MRELLYLIWKEMERTRKVKSPEIIRRLARSPEESRDWGAKSEVLIIPTNLHHQYHPQWLQMQV